MVHVCSKIYCFPKVNSLCSHSMRVLNITTHNTCKTLRVFYDVQRIPFLCVEDLIAIAAGKCKETQPIPAVWRTWFTYRKARDLSNIRTPAVVHAMPVGALQLMFTLPMRPAFADLAGIVGTIVRQIGLPSSLATYICSTVTRQLSDWSALYGVAIPFITLECAWGTTTAKPYEGTLDIIPLIMGMYKNNGPCSRDIATLILQRLIKDLGIQFFPDGFAPGSGWVTIGTALAVIALLPHLSADARVYYANSLCEAWGSDPRNEWRKQSPVWGWSGKHLNTNLTAPLTSDLGFFSDWDFSAVFSATTGATKDTEVADDLQEDSTVSVNVDTDAVDADAVDADAVDADTNVEILPKLPQDDSGVDVLVTDRAPAATDMWACVCPTCTYYRSCGGAPPTHSSPETPVNPDTFAPVQIGAPGLTVMIPDSEGKFTRHENVETIVWHLKAGAEASSVPVVSDAVVVSDALVVSGDVVVSDALVVADAVVADADWNTDAVPTFDSQDTGVWRILTVVDIPELFLGGASEVDAAPTTQTLSVVDMPELEAVDVPEVAPSEGDSDWVHTDETQAEPKTTTLEIRLRAIEETLKLVMRLAPESSRS